MTVMKAFVVVAVALAVVSLIPSANADFYIQHPRGSNNKLNEQNNNRRNQNRLFDSQNNANAGYNVGDECDGICHPDPLTRTYDSTIPGAGEGEMKYYENSYLYIEWTAQHGCGNENENTYCDIVFQFLCDDEVRNGRITPTNNGANNPDVAPLDRELAQSWDYGRHESWEFYYNCSHRIRNRGLFFGTLPNNIEDRQEENRDYAVYTRQDNNGPNDDGNGRYGFECPEERDYYPYWHPTEWIDIVVLTSAPARCGMYRSESQNVMNKGTCSNTLYNNPDACVGVDPVTGRQSNGTWEEQPSWDDIEDLDELFPDFPFDDIDAPPCEGTAWSRDNHHGNGLDGQMAHYMWQLPELKDGVDEARCVLRGRYNNTSDDYPGWETFSEANADPPIKGNPNADFLKVGVCLDSNDNEVRHYTSEECLNDLDDDYRWIPRERELRLAQNPAQFSRVFEDRTHMFKIIARPPGIADVTPIYNLNVRGRRGNIQQTYPAVEYDFTPPNLVVEQNSYIHFQWTGSDSNPNNAGQGRERTDRSNLVQIESLNKNFPIPYADNTMFKTGLLGGPDYEVIDRLAFLGQPAQNCCVKCNNDEKNDDEAEPPRCCNRENTLANDEQDFRFCGLMHMAPAYFNGGLVKMYAVGTFHFMSTRNNAYTNRSQKGTITVRVDPKIVWGVVGGIAGVAGVAAALTAAAYVYGAAHEASMCATCFTLSCRKFPCCCLCYFRTPQRALKEEEEAIAAQEKSSFRRWLAENNLKLKWLALYIVLNIGIGLYGFCTNYFIQGWSNLFRKDNTVPIWFPLAKTGGAILNLNCSLILLPVLRNFISWLRLTPLSSHIPLDSNIGFHKLVAFFIFLGSTIHVVFHYINFVSQRVSDSVPLYTTALNWAGATGHLILLGMILIFSTAAFSKIRRGRCGCKRGFDLFFNVHKLYVPIFILLWTHGQKFWLWSMWPIGLFVIEKVIRHVRSRSTTKLVSCKWVQSDVIRIRFSVKQFNYTPGQYLYINCPSVSKNEWHPFTITSAPEDDYVECHIKCKGHWTVPFGNLMVNTYNHWKKTDGSGSGSGSGSSSSVAITQNKHTVTDALDVPITTIPIRAREALGNPEIDPTMDLVRVDGPYGSASEYVFDYPVVVLVGAGIGVTPFASIMKAIKIRIKQRHCGECRARHDHSMEKEIFPKRVYFHWMCRSKEEFLWFAFLLNSIKDDGAISDIFDFKTYMTGGLDLETFRANIIRQHNAKKGKGKGGSSSGSGSGSYTEAQESYASSLSYPTTVSGSVEITEQEEEEEEGGKSKSGKKKDSSGTSSESEMAQLMQDEFLNVSNIGRPKFVKIFSDLKKKVPKGTEVGIFLCGPEAVAQAISKATFAVNTYKEGDTMFTFHKENF